jgi:hypothetical protein
MRGFTGLPRPKRSLWELVTGTRIAPIATRWREVAELQQHFAACCEQPGSRLYQLDYLAKDRIEEFVSLFASGKLGALALFNQLVYAQDELGLTVASDLVSVYLSKSAAGGYQVLLRGAATSWVLPLPDRLLLWLLFMRRKRILF